ncbi:MAG TPA: zinc ribbon domain-containing protein [Candidatus Acidoferrales bacterium]|jgi:hypothetical protein|nr:zinc ribbon domain-containing protein [Candidatus Acidoferrales bacterium]
MFCERCGNQLLNGQRFCSSCGKTVGMAIVPIERQGRVERNVQVLSILWLVCGSFEILVAIALFTVANVVFGIIDSAHGGSIGPAEPVARTVLMIVGTVVGIKGILSVTAGWGLLQRESWARPLAIVVAFIGMLHFPIGTALGIYTVWALLPNDSAAEYERLAEAA